MHCSAYSPKQKECSTRSYLLCIENTGRCSLFTICGVTKLQSVTFPRSDDYNEISALFTTDRKGCYSNPSHLRLLLAYQSSYYVCFTSKNLACSILSNLALRLEAYILLLAFAWTCRQNQRAEVWKSAFTTST